MPCTFRIVSALKMSDSALKKQLLLRMDLGGYFCKFAMVFLEHDRIAGTLLIPQHFSW